MTNFKNNSKILKNFANFFKLKPNTLKSYKKDRLMLKDIEICSAKLYKPPQSTLLFIK